MDEAQADPQRLRFLRVAYLAHLVVPLLLLLDVLLARGLGYINFHSWESDTILLVFCVLWLVVALGAFSLARDRSRFLRRAAGPLAALYAFYFCLLLLDAGAWIVLPPANSAPSVRPPNTKTVHQTDSSQLPGVHGAKAFTVDEIGLRGPAFPTDPGAYKIVTIGGSTTECAALDDSEEWPHLVMEELNQREQKTPVWVGNAGVSGQNTVQHLVLLQTLPLVRRANLLIFLIGVNDLGPALAFEGAPTQVHLEREAEMFHESLLAGGAWRYRFPLYKHLSLFRVGKGASVALKRKFSPEGAQQQWKDLTSLRKRRQEAKVLPLPDLQIGLQEYRERVLRLARQCQTLHVRCLLLTQPSMWRSDLSPADQKLLWWGNIGRWEHPNGYASAADLAKAMDAYNRTLLDVCRQDSLECYDLASVVPKDTSAFYDDQHFNEQGARIVAQHLVDYLLSKPPFAQSSASASGNDKKS